MEWSSVSKPENFVFTCGRIETSGEKHLPTSCGLVCILRPMEYAITVESEIAMSWVNHYIYNRFLILRKKKIKSKQKITLERWKGSKRSKMYTLVT